MAVNRKIDGHAIDDEQHIGGVIRGEPPDHDIGRPARTLALIVHLDAGGDLELRAIALLAPWARGHRALLRLPPDQQEEVRAGVMPVMTAVRESRIAAGVTRKTAKPAAWRHFSTTHHLARNAKARCIRLKHAGNLRVVGGLACGECWEAVIRPDERQQLVDDAYRSGRCATCGGGVTP